MGGIDDGDGKLVGCGKRRIVSWIKWYPSLPVSSPCRSFSLLHPPRSDSRFDSASFSSILSCTSLPVDGRSVAAAIIHSNVHNTKCVLHVERTIVSVDESIAPSVTSSSSLFYSFIQCVNNNSSIELLARNFC